MCVDVQSPRLPLTDVTPVSGARSEHDASEHHAATHDSIPTYHKPAILGGIEDLRVTIEPSDSLNVPSVLVRATEITWTRSARRKKIAPPSFQKATQKSSILHCRITCAHDPHPIGEKQPIKGLHLVYQWVCGNDRSTLESFVSHVNRKVAAVEAGS
ncbi:hypothetical protein JVU11DRAFT_11648 [Chiua virens]|nr:hypothetical protein JVU11DRAFT_11648 [Chiua virens]